MTDERLLEELLRSPLDDMPDRSLESWHVLVAAAVVAVAATVLFVVVLAGGDTVDDAGAGGTSAAAPGVSGDGTSASVPGEVAVFPEPGGRFHDWVALGDGTLVMFGGAIELVQAGVTIEGTWRFDAVEGTWSVMTPGISPSPRYGHAMALHPPTGRVIVFGGGETTPRPCPRIRMCPGPEDNQLWQYDPDTGIWEDMTPPVLEGVEWPIPRFGARFAYEPVTERLIMFSGVGVFGEGLTPNFWDDTWAYDPITNRWEDLTDPDENARPSGRVAYGLVWEDESQQLLMFGGDGISGDDDDHLWAFDPSTGIWVDLGVSEPGLGPTDRWFHNMEVDPRTGRVVVFGGNGSIYRLIGGGTARSNGNIDEVWAWAPAEGWVAMGPLPGDLVGAAAASDSATADILVYDGTDVWSYDAVADDWTVVWERPDEG